MDEQDFSQLIDTSLVAILSGRASLEDVLKQHPAEAELLRPELEAALWLVARQEQVSARPGFVAASRKRVVARIREEATSRGTKRAFLGFLFPRQMAVQWAMLALVMVLVFGVSGGLISASQGAIPGESLYPIKRAAEQLSFDLSPYPEERVVLSAQFLERRLFEAEALILRGSYGPAEETLTEFEREIQRSVELLAQVPDTKAEEKHQLAISLNESLENKTERIENLAKVVPDAVETQLNSAMAKTSSSALLVMNIAEEIEKNIGTPTSAPTTQLTATLTAEPTVTPGAQSTGTAVETPRPQDTPVAPSQPTQTAEEPIRGDATVEPTAQPPDGTPENEIKPTKTPKPTNENRPPKDDKPTAEPKPENTPENPEPGSETPPGDPNPNPETPPGNTDPKPEKPTDEPKPTKEPNPNKPTDSPPQDKPTKEPNPNKPTDRPNQDKPTKEPNPNKPTDPPPPDNPPADPGPEPDSKPTKETNPDKD